MMTFLYGASGHGKVVYSVLKESGLEVNVFIDDNPNLTDFLGLPVLNSFQSADTNSQGLISIGNNTIRKKISEQLHVNYISSFHTTSYIHSSVKLGQGSIVMQHATIQFDSIIGSHCIINTGAVVDHDCIIGNYAHIAPGAVLCGGVKVGEGTLVGANCTVLPSITIGKWCTIGAGAVVRHNVPDGATAIGNPARIIK
jgi:acetyltransferase EpsM